MHPVLFKPLTVLLMLGAFAGTSVAQTADRLYLSEVLAVTAKSKASYYRVADGRDGDFFVGKTFTLDGKLKAEGRYADASLNIENGAFVFYHPNGKIESQGAYQMGRKSGVWLRFDEWGRPLAEKVYDPEPLANIVYTRAESMPQYPHGGSKELVRYIKQKVTAASTEKPKGTINTSFIVEKDGALTDVKVIAGKSANIDQQVVEAIQSTSPWQPGAERGLPVRVIMRVPVQF